MLNYGQYYYKNDNGIYKISDIKLETSDYGIIYLNLVCGYDYINPDVNDIQGYVQADRFIDDIQTEMHSWYYLTESLNQCLIENGFEILEKIPIIH